MTFNLDHIYIIGRYRQGQHTLMTSRSQGQSQGHEGHFCYLAVFMRFRGFDKLRTVEAEVQQSMSWHLNS